MSRVFISRLSPGPFTRDRSTKFTFHVSLVSVRCIIARPAYDVLIFNPKAKEIIQTQTPTNRNPSTKNIHNNFLATILN